MWYKDLLSYFFSPDFYIILRYADHGSDVLSVEKDFPGLPVGASVSLLPGDTLYIPPYWHFRSQADTLSMTLEVNSPTTAESLLAEVSKCLQYRLVLGRLLIDLVIVL
jgi:hypothetical protein